MAVDIQQRIVKFVSRANWLLLVVFGLSALLFFPLHVGLGVLAGGLIVNVNFHLLARTLRKAFRSPAHASIKGPLLKYYLRFVVTGIIIFILIRTNSVDPIGLIVGLSLVVISMVLATMDAVRQLMYKEAG